MAICWEFPVGCPWLQVKEERIIELELENAALRLQLAEVGSVAGQFASIHAESDAAL